MKEGADGASALPPSNSQLDSRMKTTHTTLSSLACAAQRLMDSIRHQLAQIRFSAERVDPPGCRLRFSMRSRGWQRRLRRLGCRP